MTLRLNVNENQDSSDTPPSFPHLTTTQPSTVPDDVSFNNNRLTPIDILTVDRHSRLTLTKKLKKIIPLSPEDKIVVYQDIYNKNLVLKIQQQEKVVDNWVLARGNKDKPKNHNSTNSNNGDNANKAVVATGTSITSITSISGNKENATLHSIPILLVDDEEDLLMTFDFFLRSEGYGHVKAFSSSKSLLKHLLDSKSIMQYKLAIMDIRMPDINGIQMYQILRILNPSIKTMFLTALDAVDELTSIYPEINSTDILRKPIDKNQFIETVNDKVSRIGMA